jgi:hypothetical protein
MWNQQKRGGGVCMLQFPNHESHELGHQGWIS